ncbi:MAG: hypothetical protein WBF71_05540, partial [Microthrixaceae bacterium]
AAWFNPGTAIYAQAKFAYGFVQDPAGTWDDIKHDASKTAHWVVDHKDIVLPVVAIGVAAVVCGSVSGGALALACGAAVSTVVGGIDGAIEHCGGTNTASDCAKGVISNGAKWGATHIAFAGLSAGAPKAFKFFKSGRPAGLAKGEQSFLRNLWSERAALRSQRGSIRIGTQKLTPSGAGAAAGGGDDTVSLFRAVSQSEADDIARHGFRAHPGGRSMETKLFTTSPENAVDIGRRLYRDPGDSFHAVRVDVPQSFAHDLYRFTDVGLPSISVYPEQFGALNRLGQRSMLNALPWWPKP